MEQEKEIRKRYEEMDDRRINALKYMKEEARQKQKVTFKDFIQRKQSWFKQFAELRQKALGFSEFGARTDKYEVEERFIDLA
jgi:pyruvate dehydrogenase complex dehydrogenase (E1) component